MSDFVTAVAERVQQPVEEVSALLEEHDVRAWVASPRSPQLLVKRVSFAGTKPGGDGFDFDWEVGPGVWALSSVDNDVGKSSVLAVIRWLLSGRDAIDRVVRSWIESARLEFSIGDSDIVVDVSGGRGEVAGTLDADGTAQNFSEAGFEALMDETMLPRLNLRSLQRWQRYQGSDDGRTTRHGWTAFIPALFLPEHSSDSLLGSAPMEAGTLLQVFLGLPWYSTERQATHALARVEQTARDQQRRVDRTRERDEKLRETIARELAKIDAEIDALPDPANANRLLEESATTLAAATRRVIELTAVAGQRKVEAEATAEALNAARLELRVLRETAAAQAVFSELKANACPRCELEIGPERREAEAEKQICMVCGRDHMPDDQPDQEALLEAAEAKLADAQEIADASATRSHDAAAELEEAEAAEASARSSHEAAQPGIAVLQQLNANKVRRARLEGKVEELGERVGADEAGPSQVVPVLKAAKDEAASRMTGTDLLETLNEEILTSAHRFGLDVIDSVAINRAARLPVMKGETQVPFSELPPSEKLRLRIATVIALLRVGEVGGPARHPGLIVIDSPAAEEVADKNLGGMLAELVSLCDSNSRIQVLLATTRTDAVAEALPEAQVRFVPEGEHLW